jgi:hypothetical protein
MKGTSTCVPASTGGEGMDCTSLQYVCKPGYACFATMTGNPPRTCRKWCRYPNNGDCVGVGSGTCLGFNPAVVVNGTTYGSCF